MERKAWSVERVSFHVLRPTFYVPRLGGTMARVPFVEAVEGESPPELVSLYRDIAGLRGQVVNLYKVLANQPDALRAFMGMSRYIRDDADFPADLRELAILATGYAVGAAYEIHHHVPAARRAGAGWRWRAAGAG